MWAWSGLGPFLGAGPWSPFWCPMCELLFSCCQAMAVWQWYNNLAGRMSGGRKILRINLDETSVCLFQGTGKGTVFYSRKRQAPSGEPVQPASRKNRRTCLTHVGVICDDPALQPLLPQYVIGNFATFLLRDWRALQASCPSNVVLVRQKSAWNNTQLFVNIVHRLGVVLRPFLCSLQPVLLMDACRLHFAKPVLKACFSSHLWPVFVPARLTWLLQPCDTHVFQQYKMQLRAAYQASRVNTPRGNLNILEFMSCLYNVIRQFVQGNRWAFAFDRDGFGSSQSELSIYIRRQLQLEDPLVVSAARPSQEQLSLCFPRRAKVCFANMLPPVPAGTALARQPFGLRLFPVLRVAAPIVVARCFVDCCPAGGRVGLSVCVLGLADGREPRTRGDHRRAAELAGGPSLAP